MKSWKIFSVTAGTIIAAALLVSSAYGMGMMGNGFGGITGGYGGGMMGGGYGYGYGYTTPPYATSTGTTTTAPPTTTGYQPVYPFQFGGGCMGRAGFSGFGYTAVSPYTYTGTTLNITTAKAIAQNYVVSIGNPDLVVKQVEEYTANFYVQVGEKSTGNGAFELLFNKLTGSIYPEMGPNMMWNTKYGMMTSGILGGIYGTPTATMTLTKTQATTNAQQYLTTYIPTATTGDTTTFYGYYTIEILQGTTTYGMLSVNGYTGQIWYHNWHGTFIQELQVN